MYATNYILLQNEYMNTQKNMPFIINKEPQMAEKKWIKKKNNGNFEEWFHLNDMINQALTQSNSVMLQP